MPLGLLDAYIYFKTGKWPLYKSIAFKILWIFLRLCGTPDASFSSSPFCPDVHSNSIDYEMHGT